MTRGQPGQEADALAARIAERFAAGGRVEALAPDASTRRFFRVHLPKSAPLVALVDEAGGRSALERMVAARTLLEEVGVRVPKIYERDDALGALLFEDFGGQLLADVLEELPPANALALYRQAGRFTARIARDATRRVAPDHPLASPRLDRERLRVELAFFAVHEVAGRRGHVDPLFLAELGHFLDWVADEAAGLDATMAHRDFHARNLMLLEDGTLGVLDFQDARFAPWPYDLVSLVRDPYVEPGKELERAALEGWVEEGGNDLPRPEGDALGWAALQRGLKALGTYGYQVRVLERTRFASAIAAGERLVQRALDELPAEVGRSARPLLERIGFARE